MNMHEARQAYQQERALFEERGIYLAEDGMYIPDGWKQNFAMALDAQPALSTTPNSGVPVMLTTLIDPEVYNILFAANRAATIFGERRKGTWLDDTALFPVVESAGEVSSYGDYSENGMVTANTNWPNRQAYLYQTVVSYGQRELERAGLGRINWIAELDRSSAMVMDKFQNLTYFYGINGLENYGLLNDPNLSAALTPAMKAYGGTAWIVNNVIKATALEVYTDIQSLYLQLVEQSNGLIDLESELTLAMSPESAVALTATNNFNVNVKTLLKENFPKIKIETAVQYGAITASNPQGYAAGNFVQLIVKSVEGQDTGYCSFNEKFRAHTIVRGMSSFKQKRTGGTWGAVIRQPFGISSLVGV
jgi:hypothetical protein